MALIVNHLNKTKYLLNLLKRHYTVAATEPKILFPEYFHFCSKWGKNNEQKSLDLIRDMKVYDNFLTETDEKNLFNEVESYLKRMRYEFDHWDDAIHGFRETERQNWNENNTKIINRVRDLAFPKNVAQLRLVHVLDLAPKGYIKPHIDAVRFCGNTIAGLSLLSDCIMRLVDDKDKKLFVDIYLKKRSLYVMRDTARYDYTHEVLEDKYSVFNNTRVPRDRRISIICRNEPV